MNTQSTFTLQSVSVSNLRLHNLKYYIRFAILAFIKNKNLINNYN